MKKYKNLLLSSSLMLLLQVLGIILVFFIGIGERPNRVVGIIGLSILFLWFLGIVFLLIFKKQNNHITTKGLLAANGFVLGVLLIFGCLYVLAINHSYTGGFSLQSPLFQNKKVLVFVPHQDDDVNLVGGLIEQYTQQGSEVSVVFTTNGDSNANVPADIRAAEVLEALNPVGVKKENIYYLGFGDQWMPMTHGTDTIQHIYSSVDPDALWTSRFGATATYGTESIDCYLDIPYTRNNFLLSFQSIILEKMPDVIFAIDFDTHIDHKATDLFFEEALYNILRSHPDYHPTVYKGFGYGTAWEAVADYHDDINLLSSIKPVSSIWEQTSYGYTWEDRVRFPMSSTNLNLVLMNNSVYQSLNSYASYFAQYQAVNVLNGDKVFWERRTDSLLYNADIRIDGESSTRLNDFKLKDFSNLPDSFVGFECLIDKTVSVTLPSTTVANCIYLYDHPSESENILEGYLVFSDGSKIEFGELVKNGSATRISFPDKEIEWFKIVPIKTEGNFAGLSEIELYYDVPKQPENPYIMAVDETDNFVYDYILHDRNSVTLTLYHYPHGQSAGQDDVTMTFQVDGKDASCHWEGDKLIVTCAKGSKCTVTITTENASTTFTVSNPTVLSYGYQTALRNIGKASIDIRYFLYRFYLFFYRMVVPS